MSLEPIEVFTDPDWPLSFFDALLMNLMGKHIGSTKATAFYLREGKVYGVSIAFQNVKVYECEAFKAAVESGGIPGYVGDAS